MKDEQMTRYKINRKNVTRFEKEGFVSFEYFGKNIHGEEISTIGNINQTGNTLWTHFAPLPDYQAKYEALVKACEGIDEQLASSIWLKWADHAKAVHVNPTHNNPLNSFYGTLIVKIRRIAAAIKGGESELDDNSK